MRKFSEVLKIIFAQKHTNANELAEKMKRFGKGKNSRSIYNMLYDKSNPSYKFLTNLCQLYDDISFDSLLFNQTRANCIVNAKIKKSIVQSNIIKTREIAKEHELKKENDFLKDEIKILREQNNKLLEQNSKLTELLVNISKQ